MKTLPEYTEKPELAELLDKVPLLPAEKVSEPQTTCVTGATSTIGAHVVRRLLRAGHTVHAPVRGSETTADVAYLKAMPGAERLKLFYGVDLLVDGSYDAAMVGCSSVHHVASPFYMCGSKKNIQNKLIDPAIKGTENVLASCSRTPTVKRVVVTGTVLVACCDFRQSINNKDWTVTEESWEGDCSPKSFPYVYSKRTAEKRAMEIAAAQTQWTLVTLLVAAAFGPPVSSNGQGIVPMFHKYIRLGLFWPACPPMGCPMQDIRDVAATHSLAMTNTCTGRYIVPQRWGTFYEACRALKSDSRTSKCMLPFFTFPSCFKPVLAVAAPILGIDKSLPKRTWGASPKIDYAKTTRDFDLDAQEFKRIDVMEMMVDTELAFKLHKIPLISASLKRYK